MTNRQRRLISGRLNWLLCMYRLNYRPRKGLDYQTPHAVFFAKVERKAV